MSRAISGSLWDGEAIVPAKLAFLTLYNPSLGRTDETLHDQLVYYYSSKSSKRRGPQRISNEASVAREHEEQNERLRQIGLAQGMVEFAKAFSDGESLDSVNSEKSRTLLHEVEPGWWILASVDLTRLQSAPDRGTLRSTSKKDSSTIEYSSREVCPQTLLLQHLLRAHRIFLLHHASSLADLYARLTRPKFCAALEHFWDKFVQEWDVLLHGNPAVDIYNGLKLAAGGELGIGVGEEEWGSGEREVLEGFIARTEGLVDAVVSRFGDLPKETELASQNTLPSRSIDDTAHSRPWLGAGAQPSPSDGVIFSGVGALTRSSLRDVSAWTEWLYTYGQAAYGVQESPHSGFRKKRRKIHHVDKDLILRSSHTSGSPNNRLSYQSELQNEPLSADHREAVADPGIPPPIIIAAGRSAKHAQLPSEVRKPDSKVREQGKQNMSPSHDGSSAVGADTIMKYMTLGLYGSSWGLLAGRPSAYRNNSSYRQRGEDATAIKHTTPLLPVEPKPIMTNDDSIAAALQKTMHGMFMVGFQGDLDDEEETEDEANGTDGGGDRESSSISNDWNGRLLVRTLTVERTMQIVQGQSRSGDAYHDRLRVIVYVRRPFIFTFLFELQTVSLTMTSFYRSIHHQLGPLQRPLLISTSPSKVSQRLWEAADPKSTTSVDSAQPIYDLVYDPANLTVHTTIPNIPNSGTFAAEGLEPSEASWTRIEALSVHCQILNTYVSTRRRALELERTCKTSRGWWVVWMRLSSNSEVQQTAPMPSREAFLIRKASDYIAPTAQKASSIFGRGTSESSGWAPAKLAEGIGIDTRRYIEGLLSLNR